MPHIAVFLCLTKTSHFCNLLALVRHAAHFWGRLWLAFTVKGRIPGVKPKIESQCPYRGHPSLDEEIVPPPGY